MRLFLTAAIFLGGLLFAYMALNFLIQPETAAAGLGMKANGATGIATLRGDMTAFFGLTSFGMLYGAWKRNGDILLIPAFLMGCALLGRIITIFTDGTEQDYFGPMIVEAVFVILTLIGSRLLPHPVTDGDDAT